MYSIAYVLAAYLAANLAHRILIFFRCRNWEKKITRDSSGIFSDAHPYNMGDGKIAILFIHGFADTPRVFYRMVQRLADTGDFSCYVIRLPGSGEIFAKAAKVTLEDMLVHIQQQTEQLRAKHETVFLAGHSMGAALALATYFEKPASMDGVIALTPLIQVSRSQSPVLPAYVWYLLSSIIFALSPVFESCFSADGIADDDPDFKYQRDRFIPFATYRTIFRLVKLLKTRAHKVTVPLFAVLAGKDRVVDTNAANAWLNKCPAEKTIMLLPESKHTVLLGPEWLKITDSIAFFIKNNASYDHE